jgi:uncharacterized protein YjbI with pentapeptide repeats
LRVTSRGLGDVYKRQNLYYADLTGANMTGAILTGANITGAIIPE